MNDPTLTSFAAYNYIQGQSDYSNSSSLYNQLNLSLEIIAVLYLLNIIDAALVGSANSETSTSEGKVIPFFKTRRLESIQAERPSGNFFPNSFEFGIKIFL